MTEDALLRDMMRTTAPVTCLGFPDTCIDIVVYGFFDSPAGYGYLGMKLR